MSSPHDALPGRQVHLDFHNSAAVDDVGRDFDGAVFAAALRAAAVESIVLFAKCHHGWSYYDTRVGARHPTLGFDLLRAQVEACRGAGLRVVLYLSVGWDERLADGHQDWRQLAPEGTFRCFPGRALEATWSYLCLGSPYLEVIEAQMIEVLEAFPQAEGLWLDIVKQQECCCPHCRRGMECGGLDWTQAADRERYREQVLARYLERCRAAADRVRPDIPVFQNTSTLPRGDRELLGRLAPLEIEAVPTGGWGYDHLPLSARYAGALGYSPMGITVRFHVVWGEFGSVKAPHALRAEAMTMLSLGARVSVGDQLDPRGTLDASAVALIGDCFAAVREREPWCRGSRNVAEVALLSSAAVCLPGSLAREARHCEEDEGALRALSEGHVLFDVIDGDGPFEPYRVLVLPDRVRVSQGLARRLEAFLAQGGRLLLTGESGLASESDDVALPVPGIIEGPSPFDPVYFALAPALAPAYVRSPLLVRGPSLRLRARPGAALGRVHEPSFKRSARRWSGHQHAAARPESSGYDCAAEGRGILYLAAPLFGAYRRLGDPAVREVILRALGRLLGPSLLETDAPSGALVTLREQREARRYLLHVVHAPRVLSGQTRLGPLEVIADPPRLGPMRFTLRLRHPLRSARCVPDGTRLGLSQSGGTAQFELPSMRGDALIELDYEPGVDRAAS